MFGSDFWAGGFGAGCAEAAAFCCAKDIRFRGAGGGSSGSSPKRSVNSANDGMGVVRALEGTFRVY